MQVVVNDGVAHFGNVQLCGNVHACPVCSARIRSERAIEVEQGVSQWLRAGHGALFATLTIRHGASMPLAWTLDAVVESFRSMLSGRWWQETCERYGIEGQIRSLEITHGGSGWHPHLHVLVLTHRRIPRVMQLALQAALFERWSARIVGHGLPAPLPGPGCVVRPVTLGNGELLRYLCKVQDADRTRSSIGLEMARSDLKQGRWHGRTALQVLEDAFDNGDAGDLALWHEYERATKGRNVLTWSRGLKAALGVVERTDQEIVAEQVGGEVVAELPDGLYGLLCAIPGALVAILEAAEDGGTEAVQRALSRIAGAA